MCQSAARKRSPSQLSSFTLRTVPLTSGMNCLFVVSSDSLLTWPTKPLRVSADISGTRERETHALTLSQDKHLGKTAYNAQDCRWLTATPSIETASALVVCAGRTATGFLRCEVSEHDTSDRALKAAVDDQVETRVHHPQAQPSSSSHRSPEFLAAAGTIAVLCVALGLFWFTACCAKVAPCFYIHDDDEESTTVSDTDAEAPSLIFASAQHEGHRAPPVKLNSATSTSARTGASSVHHYQRSGSAASDKGEGGKPRSPSSADVTARRITDGSGGAAQYTSPEACGPRTVSASDAQAPTSATYGSLASFSQQGSGSQGVMSSAIGLLAADTAPGSASSVLAPQTRNSRASSSPTLSISDTQRALRDAVRNVGGQGGGQSFNAVPANRGASLSPFLSSKASPKHHVPPITDDSPLPSAEHHDRSNTLDTTGVTSSAASSSAVAPRWCGTPGGEPDMLDDSQHSSSILATAAKGGSPLAVHHASGRGRHPDGSARAASAEVNQSSPMYGAKRGSLPLVAGQAAANAEDGSGGHVQELPTFSLGSAGHAAAARGRAASLGGGGQHSHLRPGEGFGMLRVHTGTSTIAGPSETFEEQAVADRGVSHASSQSDVPRVPSGGSSAVVSATNDAKYAEMPPTMTPTMQRARSHSRSRNHTMGMASPMSGGSRRSSHGLSPTAPTRAHRRSRTSSTVDSSAMTSVQQLVGGRMGRRASGGVEHNSSKLTTNLGQVSRREIPDDAFTSPQPLSVDSGDTSRPVVVTQSVVFKPLDSQVGSSGVGLPKSGGGMPAGSHSVSELPPSHGHQPAASASAGSVSPAHSMPEYMSSLGAASKSGGSMGHLRVGVGAQTSSNADPSPTAGTPGTHLHTPMHGGSSALMAHSSQESMLRGSVTPADSPPREVHLTSPPAARRISATGHAHGFGPAALLRAQSSGGVVELDSTAGDASPADLASVRTRRTSLSTNDLLSVERARGELMAEMRGDND